MSRKYVPFFFLSAFGSACSLVRVDEMDLGLAAFVFELVVLCACVILCASTLVIPSHHSPRQDDVLWRRMSDVAAAAAAAAVEEATPNPSNETVHVIQIDARAATAATATAHFGDPLELSTVPWGLRRPGGTSKDSSAISPSEWVQSKSRVELRMGRAAARCTGKDESRRTGGATVWSSDGAAA